LFQLANLRFQISPLLTLRRFELPLELADLRPDFLADAILLSPLPHHLGANAAKLLIEFQQPINVNVNVLVTGALLEPLRMSPKSLQINHRGDILTAIRRKDDTSGGVSEGAG